jgi:ankyrin repeat protein
MYAVMKSKSTEEDDPLLRVVRSVRDDSDIKKIVEALLRMGADVNVKDREGKTALNYATLAGLHKIRELLEKH